MDGVRPPLLRDELELRREVRLFQLVANDGLPGFRKGLPTWWMLTEIRSTSGSCENLLACPSNPEARPESANVRLLAGERYIGRIAAHVERGTPVAMALVGIGSFDPVRTATPGR